MGSIKVVRKDGTECWYDDKLSKEEREALDKEDNAYWERQRAFEDQFNIMSKEEQDKIKHAQQTFYERQLALGGPLDPKMDNYWLTDEEKKRLAKGGNIGI